ncbi:MAG: DUF3520 domain-containing protein [Candidatus Latescibacteria bacterium]|nr:DUF3520 domain-containing protein [Candidatus Latescibacterota bacterium]
MKSATLGVVLVLGTLSSTLDGESASFDHVVETAAASKGNDATGYRAEFVELAETCKKITPEVSGR